jgi:hypothetical protein
MASGIIDIAFFRDTAFIFSSSLKTQQSSLTKVLYIIYFSKEVAHPNGYCKNYFDTEKDQLVNLSGQLIYYTVNNNYTTLGSREQ